MKAQLLGLARRNSRYVAILTGLFLGTVLTSVFRNRSVDWSAALGGTLVGALTVWGIQYLWAGRKGRRDSGEMKIVAAIVIAGGSQFLFLMVLIDRGFKPQGVETWIAPVIMLGMVAMLIWKKVKSTAI